MITRSLMFQGTGSDVGKSLVMAGLCRLMTRRGLRVMPFKAQNMSNNAAVAADGGEIGRAQWLQAVAAGAEPSVHMNPVLLKPQSDRMSQVIVRGKVAATLSASEYQSYRVSLLPVALESYRRLAEQADIVLVEGAGSAAEINLRRHDIANMGFARAAQCPVILIGDIDRGGVIASLVGTHAVLPEADQRMIQGFLINKFRGDAQLFVDGTAAIETRTGWPALGLIPHHAPLMQLPQEDSLALARQEQRDAPVHVAVLAYPHIANFDDFDPLASEPGVRLTWCREGDALPADARLVILPGSKCTMESLAFLKAQGWDIDLRAHHRRGGHILGICGGFQMLGKSLSDPHGLEGNAGRAEGLGLLDIATTFSAKKTVAHWQGEMDTGAPVTGYEIHLGVSEGEAMSRPLFQDRAPEGARSEDDRIWGTYVHGIFANDHFRQHVLARLGAAPSSYRYTQHLWQILDGWADVLEQSVSIDRLLSIAAPVPEEA
ncbi:MAG: cobyric acid synthase [Pseudomonadota bacterium]|nr:cobyric acid synthase [Pseudomonadota bacterium]